MVVLQVVIDFAPWILLTSWSGDMRHGAVASLAFAAAVCAHGRWHGRLKILPVATLVAFTLLTAMVYLGLEQTVRAHALPLGNLMLAGAVLASIAFGDPFIRAYAREREPERIWSHPLFLQVTRYLSFVWAGAFVAMAGLQLLSDRIPDHRTALRWYLPYLVNIAAVAYSFWYAQRVRRQRESPA